MWAIEIILNKDSTTAARLSMRNKPMVNLNIREKRDAPTMQQCNGGDKSINSLKAIHPHVVPPSTPRLCPKCGREKVLYKGYWVCPTMAASVALDSKKRAAA